MKVVNRTVKLTLVGLDGNAFSLMAAFTRAARREKWPQTDIDAVLDEAMKGDYAHLLATLSAHCNEDGSGADDETVEFGGES